MKVPLEPTLQQLLWDWIWRSIVFRLGVLRELLWSTSNRPYKLPVYREERAIQELRAEEGLSFPDNRMKFLEAKPKTGTQSYASTLRHPSGIDSIS
jgi:hypothetical protein